MTGTGKAAAGDEAKEKKGRKRQGQQLQGQMYFRRELLFTFWCVGRTARTVSAVL